MSTYSDSENLNPRFDQPLHGSLDGIYSENQNPHQSHHNPSTLKNYSNSISKPSQKLISSYSNHRYDTIPSKRRVPVITSFKTDDVKDSVRKLLVNDARKNENVVLKQLNNSHVNSSSSRILTSPIVPYQDIKFEDEKLTLNFKSPITADISTKSIKDIISADSQYDDVLLFDLYKADDDSESKIDPTLAAILDSGEQVTSRYPDAIVETHSLSKDDPRISYLNSHQAYVKVNYPQYTKPLAEDGLPLDLSQVPKQTFASPFFDYEVSKKMVPLDEQKLLKVLEHDMKLSSCGVGDYFENKNSDITQFDFKDLEEDYYDPNNKGVVTFFKKLFKLGPFSDEAKYYRKFPWARIFHNIDNPPDLEDQVITYDKTLKSVGFFERNNTDMFPLPVLSSPLEQIPIIQRF